MDGPAEAGGGVAPPQEEPVRELLLENQLCFLVYRLHRKITDLYRPLLAELGLTYPQYLVMLALWENHPQSVSELGARLDLQSGTLSPLLKRLETAGILSRARSAADERSVQVDLTEAGRELRQAAQEVPAHLAAAIAGSQEEYLEARRQLTVLLERIARASGP
ncbi:MAG: MarR family winged helix-turn-helix transcriptional regulator [Candidatus Nanopelagicales bacterium]